MSTGIYLPNNKSSSTPDFHFHQLSANLQENNRNNSTVSELPPEYYSYLITEIQSLKASVGDLKKVSDSSKIFFNESVLLQRVCLTIIILLPLVLTAIAGVIVLTFSSEPSLVAYAKWGLGILGLSSAVDLFFIFATHKITKERIEQIERRLDKLDS